MSAPAGRALRSGVILVILLAGGTARGGVEPTPAPPTPTHTPTPTCGCPPTSTPVPTPTLITMEAPEPCMDPENFIPYDRWVPEPPIGCIVIAPGSWVDWTDEILEPSDGELFAVCQEVTFTCERAVDYDTYWSVMDYYEDCYKEPDAYPLDTMAETGYPRWQCSRGCFVDSAVGQSVVWKAPETPGTVTISLWDNDLPEPVTGLNARWSRDDQERMVDQVQITVFELTVTGGPPEGKSYIGRKETFNATISPSALHQQYKNSIQWTVSGGSPVPSGGTAETLSTRNFATADSVNVRVRAQVTIAGKTVHDDKEFCVRDIFMYSDSGPGAEYGGKYPGNPQLGAYASRLVTGSGWNTGYVELDGNGDPCGALFNPGWLDKYRSDVNHKARTLRNCKWTNEGDEIVLKFPFTGLGGGGEHLEAFIWKGHREPYVILDGQHYWENMDKIKNTYCNCHGNSAHAYGAETLLCTCPQIQTYLSANLGATYSKIEDVTIGQIETGISEGDILIFDGHADASGASHSAYVSAKTACASDCIVLWACDAGVSAKGTKNGFDEVYLSEYLEEHTREKFSYLHNIQ